MRRGFHASHGIGGNCFEGGVSLAQTIKQKKRIANAHVHRKARGGLFMNFFRMGSIHSRRAFFHHHLHIRIRVWSWSAIGIRTEQHEPSRLESLCYRISAALKVRLGGRLPLLSDYKPEPADNAAPTALATVSPRNS